METTGVLAVQLRTEIWKHDLKGHGIKLRQKKVNVLLTKVVIPSGENRRETGDLRSRGTCCFADAKSTAHEQAQQVPPRAS